MDMKRLLVFIAFIVTMLPTTAQDVKLTIVDGIQDQKDKARMETGISGLLSEINSSGARLASRKCGYGSQRQTFVAGSLEEPAFPM